MGNFCSWREGAGRKAQLGTSESKILGRPVTQEVQKMQPLSEEEDNDDDVVDAMPEPSSLSNKRQSVSAECYGEHNNKTDFVPRVFPKPDATKTSIRSRLADSFLFAQSIEDGNIETLIDAFEEVTFEKDAVVITQGDDGDLLYVIEKGSVEVWKKSETATDPVLVNQLGPGDTFGELALMYNAPRAATVKSASALNLWALDRNTFNHVIKNAAAEKRSRNEALLQQVPLLADMDSYERLKVSDALKTQKFQSGVNIIKEGENGDIFYIVVEGEAQALKGDMVVMEYKKGDYFGELALLKNQPRAASVRAKNSGCTVLYLDGRSFGRLLGPVRNILGRSKDNYKKVCEELGISSDYLD